MACTRGLCFCYPSLWSNQWVLNPSRKSFFPYVLIYSHFLVNRVNSLTKLSSVCTDRQTNAKLSTKLLNVIEGLNAPVWPLTGRGFTTLPSRKLQIKKTTHRKVTMTRSWGTTFLLPKISLRISLAPFAITGATLLTTYVFLTNTFMIRNSWTCCFQEIFTKASRSFIRTANWPRIWWRHARRIHRFRSKFHTLRRKQDLFCSNMLHLLHQLRLTEAVRHYQPSYTSRYYVAFSC